MKIMHYLSGIFFAALFLDIPAASQENTSAEEAAPVLKLGLYADTSSTRVVDIRADGVLRGFDGVPENGDRELAAESKGLLRVRIYHYNYGRTFLRVVYVDVNDSCAKYPNCDSTKSNIYFLYGTYRITGKRLIFNIPKDHPFDNYGPLVSNDGAHILAGNYGGICRTPNPFADWGGKTLTFFIIGKDGKSFTDQDGNSWMRISD